MHEEFFTSLINIVTSSYWKDFYPDTSLYRPLTILSYMINQKTCGNNPIFFRIPNIILHGAVSFFLLIIFTAMVRSKKAGFSLALIFLVHPVHTEVVSGIVGRAELLCTLFMLIGFWFYLLFYEKGHRRFLVFSNLSFCLALFSKENAIIFPGIILIYELIVGPKFGKNVRYVASFFIVALTYLLLRHHILGGLGPKASGIYFSDVPSEVLFFTAVKILFYYFRLLVLPFFQSADYTKAAISLVDSPFDWRFLAGFLISFFFITYSIYFFRKEKLKVFFLLAFFIAIFPVSNLFIKIGTNMGDRLVYFPGIFFLAFLVRQMELHSSKYFIFLSSIIVVTFSYLTINYSAHWKNNELLWSYSEKNAPLSAKVLHNLAVAKMEKGEFSEALGFLQKALRIVPDDKNISDTLIALYIQMGELKKARERADRIYESNQLGFHLLNNLGVICLKEQKLLEAKKYFNKALEFKDGTVVREEAAKLFFNLGNVNFLLQDFTGVEKNYEEGFRLSLNNSELVGNLFTLYFKTGQKQKVREKLDILIKNIREISAEIVLVMANAEYLLGNLEKAAFLLDVAHEKDPDKVKVIELRNKLRSKN